MVETSLNLHHKSKPNIITTRTRKQTS